VHYQAKTGSIGWWIVHLTIAHNKCSVATWLQLLLCGWLEEPFLAKTTHLEQVTKGL
jgi:hypothetical protein